MVQLTMFNVFSPLSSVTVVGIGFFFTHHVVVTSKEILAAFGIDLFNDLFNLFIYRHLTFHFQISQFYNFLDLLSFPIVVLGLFCFYIPRSHTLLRVTENRRAWSTCIKVLIYRSPCRIAKMFNCASYYLDRKRAEFRGTLLVVALYWQKIIRGNGAVLLFCEL